MSMTATFGEVIHPSFGLESIYNAAATEEDFVDQVKKAMDAYFASIKKARGRIRKMTHRELVAAGICDWHKTTKKRVVDRLTKALSDDYADSGFLRAIYRNHERKRQMNVSMTCSDGSTLVLTTEHPASSYGQPVLVFPDGDAFGPLDRVPSVMDGTLACDFIPAPMRLDDSQRRAVDAFLAGCPEAVARREAQWG